ncbi:MAG: 1-(5-phosphoribosyl)-5-[(5-phosphoribosylamino)methylideneamino]imidazole-4-carboxamide isomerase [Rickettsiales bacterium]
MTLTLYPAIDLKNGQCVRLLRGDMDKATVFAEKPSEQAKTFETAGFKWLHLVDLNGAIEGRPVNAEAVASIRKTVSMPIQLGGGIRTIEQISYWLEAGITRVILGTVALKNPALVNEACKLFPGTIAVGIDARGGKVAVEGWVETSEVKATDLAKSFEDSGVSAIIYTDIGRDGALMGPNIDETLALAQAVRIPIILSGGVSSIRDVENINAVAAQGISGAIIGRALYERTILPEEALRIAS